MKQIKKITRIQRVGVFRDFEWPADLLEFSRFNLIYGWNGSGKTTLSRLFRDLELRRMPLAGKVEIRINNEDKFGSDFPNLSLPIRVFNRDFVEESVFPVKGGDLPPIFVFGRESVEKQKEVEKLKQQLESEMKGLSFAQERKKEAERDFEKFIVDKAKFIKDMLTSSGSNQYRYYNKSDFKRDTEKMISKGNKESYLLSEEEREKLLKQINATRKQKVEMLSYQVPPIQQLADKVSALLSTTVVSKVIQSLKDDPKLADWTRQGIVLHKERQSKKCLFCEQLLPGDRLEALEAHFSADFEQFMRRLDNMISWLDKASGEVAEVTTQLPNRVQLYEHLSGEFDDTEKALREALKSIQQFLQSLVQELKKKKAKPFDVLAFHGDIPSIDEEAVNRLNEVIRKHNQVCDEFDSVLNNARDRLAQDIIAQNIWEYDSLKGAVQKSIDGIEEIENKIKELKDNIRQLEHEIIEHRRPAEELNEDLKKYLGHSDLQVEVKETGYTITRNGQSAEKLSEGEMNAIALLYFLKSLEDRNFDLKNGIVVIDDPVSSLDANALYLAYGYIRKRTKDAGQLFIFTHNFSFFSQVRNWFHYLNGRKKDPNRQPAHFYMLERTFINEQRHAIIRPLDPLLEKYNSEYQYLFSCIYRVAESNKPEALEQAYSLPNMARRFLESFIAFRRPDKTGELWKKMEDIPFDEAKKMRILRFLNTYSHSDALDEPKHDPYLLSEANSVLKDLLDLVKDLDPEHYDSLVRLVNQPAE